MPSTPAAVLHVPHSSVYVPPDVRPGILLPDAALSRELLAMTDHFTDELFALSPEMATAVVHPVSRLVVDPERFEDDEKEAMAKRGMGVVYTRTSDGKVLRETPSPAERNELLDRFYRPHHERLRAAVSDALRTHARCLIIDGHSFPSRPLPYEDDQDPDRPEICIGTDAYHTPAACRDAAVAAFEREGFRVAIDRPFSGAIVPAAYLGRDERVSSVMIEVNRSLYLDEATGRRHPGMAELQIRLQRALGALIESLKRPSGSTRTEQTT